MQYTSEQLITMLTSNNLPGIHARLVTDGLVSGYAQPSVDSLSYAISEKWEKTSSSDEFFAWMERLFDTPIDQMGMYYGELQAIPAQTGKTPAKMLVDQLRLETPQTELKRPNILQQPGGNWLPTLFWILAIIGLLAVLRFAAKLVAKVTE